MASTSLGEAIVTRTAAASRSGLMGPRALLASVEAGTDLPAVEVSFIIAKSSASCPLYSPFAPTVCLFSRKVSASYPIIMPSASTC